MVSWDGLRLEAAKAARGLLDLDLGVGDRIAILGPTHIEWTVYDLAGHLLGLVTLGVYPRQSAEQIRFLLENSGARVIFVAEEHELEVVLEAAEGIETLEAIVPWYDDLAERFEARDSRIVPPATFRGDPLDMETSKEILAKVQPEDTAILVYTSGTTGHPKGAMITHANILAVMRSAPDIFPFHQDDVAMAFLPMAHVTERVLSFYVRLETGMPTAYATAIGSVLEEVAEVRPTIFGSVPRIFEKAHARVFSEMGKKPAAVQALFRWALGIGHQCAQLQLADQPIPWTLELRRRLAHALVFKKIQAAFGGRVRACITGAAPISEDILEFFWAIGMPIFEGYGQTEATVITHITRFGAVKLGTVGPVIPPMECRIADDGEVLLKGPFVFAGYWKNEDATRSTVVDGWLHSGDIGELDDEGFLRITDRKKHLIITAGGKNLAPANIERAIKSQSPLISQIHVHGDRRPYVSAILAPSPLDTLAWGRTRGLIDAREFETLEKELLANPTARSEALVQAMAQVTREPDFRQLFVDPVNAGNQQLARVERVRRFVVLDRDFSQEAGELTPTMKMRRKELEANHADLLESIYTDEPGGESGVMEAQ